MRCLVQLTAGRKHVLGTKSVRSARSWRGQAVWCSSPRSAEEIRLEGGSWASGRRSASWLSKLQEAAKDKLGQQSEDLKARAKKIHQQVATTVEREARKGAGKARERLSEGLQRAQEESSRTVEESAKKVMPRVSQAADAFRRAADQATEKQQQLAEASKLAEEVLRKAATEVPKLSAEKSREVTKQATRLAHKAQELAGKATCDQASHALSDKAQELAGKATDSASPNAQKALDLAQKVKENARTLSTKLEAQMKDSGGSHDFAKHATRFANKAQELAGKAAESAAPSAQQALGLANKVKENARTLPTKLEAQLKDSGSKGKTYLHQAIKITTKDSGSKGKTYLHQAIKTGKEKATTVIKVQAKQASAAATSVAKNQHTKMHKLVKERVVGSLREKAAQSSERAQQSITGTARRVATESSRQARQQANAAREFIPETATKVSNGANSARERIYKMFTFDYTKKLRRLGYTLFGALLALVAAYGFGKSLPFVIRDIIVSFTDKKEENTVQDETSLGSEQPRIEMKKVQPEAEPPQSVSVHESSTLHERDTTFVPEDPSLSSTSVEPDSSSSKHEFETALQSEWASIDSKKWESSRAETEGAPSTGYAQGMLRSITKWFY
eukprot:CAMPEP_0184535472 /NCGR_PEP_ID=MMETSP0198_2-20121128/15913_1 /TAXON_ID=1112570 /ORGANISM="Thraustochytrium sp., Strain LLF1b" /LENGTH=618 /DNA_ID=CAMNT_0026928527 /DNA_START=16 /DNA_END=1874 /DNA_ORIENTATION=+